MKTNRRTFRHASPLALALLCAFPAMAQTAAPSSTEEILKELQALKAKAAELEKRLEAAEAQRAEQKQELSRVAVKAEALEDSRDAMGMKLFKVSGYMDPTYIYSRVGNVSSVHFLNGVGDGGYSFDNSTFGVVGLDFLKETESGTKFHVTLVPSRGAESVAVYGNRLLQEASVSVPLGSPTTLLLAGMLPDWSGYEAAQPHLNKLITHNILYDFTLPVSYTGAGLQMASGPLTVKTMVGNMNASRKAAGQKTPVFAYRADYAVNEFVGIGSAGVFGKAANLTQNVTSIDPVTGVATVIPQGESGLALFEIDTTYTRGPLTLQGQFSAGMQQRAAITADPNTGTLRDAQWWGVSALAAYRFTPRFEGAVRLDYIGNSKNGGGLLTYAAADYRNGIGPDPAGDPEIGANRMALSVGGTYQFDTNTLLKAEYRIDRASQPVFQYLSDGSFRRTTQLLGAAVVVSF